MARRQYEELDGHDAYDLLGVPEDASPEEIRRAFRRQLRVWHPDPQQDPESRRAADRRTRYLTIARDVLLNDRAGYDEHRRTARRRAAQGTRAETTGETRSKEARDPWADAAKGTVSNEPWRATGRGPAAPRHEIPTWGKVLLIVWLAPPLMFLGLLVSKATSSSSPSDVSALPPPTVAVSGQYAGWWSGTVTSAGSTNQVKVAFRLRRGTEYGDMDYGDMEYPRAKCTGRLRPLRVEGDTLVVYHHVSQPSDSCADGEVRLTHDRRKFPFVFNELRMAIYRLKETSPYASGVASRTR